MQVFKTKKKLKTYFKDSSSSEYKIGLVPTMGALHEGHLSLIAESRKNNAITVVSIFVNPTQFDKAEDLEKYPRTLTEDLSLLEKAGCDVVFVPSVKEIYNEDVSSIEFDFDGLENQMEGEFRKGHFNGVGTIVKAFFEIITPTHAYFGEKDFQQLQIIKKMVEKTHLPVVVIGCPTYREENGLAMSSRNKRLSKQQKKEASIIYKTLKKVRENIHKESISQLNEWVESQFKNNPLFELEYFAIAEESTLKTAVKVLPNKTYRAFIGVYAGSVRLIDTLSLHQ
ncbi:MAG: pantoate--beta-alanine ligase [Flavobacteriaceae bacterium]